METLHIISHTHWDREWYQTFQQFRLRLVHLLDNVLTLLENDPGFEYFMLDGQAIVLDDYLEMRPEREKELSNLVESGRLLIGPWYILPDEFLVSPEALVRNLLEGDRVCKRFGSKMNIGYIPDPFGHIGQMPQILRGFDIHFACLWRGLGDEPCEFWWQSPDGTPVLMAYLRDSYSNAAALPTSDPARFSEESLRLAASLASHSACSQRLLMFGTDHAEPPVDTSNAISYARDNFPNTRFLHSTLPAYLAATTDELTAQGTDLPVVRGELRSSKRSPLLPGVLSTRIWIKQRNNACENLLERWAEPFTTWASMVAGDPPMPTYQSSDRIQMPANLLRQAWRLLLTCQPHDSICGCSIDQVHEEMRPRFDQVDQIATELTRQSLITLANNIDSRTPDDCFAAIVVFNPLPGPRSEPVELEVLMPPGIDNFEVMEQKPDNKLSILQSEITGLGSGELIHMVMSPEEFRNASGMVQGGRVNGMVIRDLDYQRQVDTILVQIVLSEHGEPNTEALASGMNRLDQISTDQSIRHFEVIARSADAVRLHFLAQDVYGPGFQTFWLRKAGSTSTRTIQPNMLTRLAMPLAKKLINSPLANRWSNSKKTANPPYTIENEAYRLEVISKNGSLELLDKRSGIRFSGLNSFVDGGDCGDTYNYCSPAIDEFYRPTRLQRVSIIASPFSQRLDVFQKMRIPAGLNPDRKARSKKMVSLQIHTTITLWTGSQRIDFHTRIINHAEDHRLRVHFPMPFSASQASYDDHYDIVKRRVGVPEWDMSWVEQPRPENPQRMFTAVSDGETGFILAVRGLPEIEVREREDGMSELALTLLRCVGWLSRDDLLTRPGHAGPFLPTPGAQMPGEYEFDYAIICYSEASNNQAKAIQQARYFCAPMRTEATEIHQGELPAQCQLVQIQPATFEISAIKQAENGSGWILRGYNPLAESIKVTIQPWRRFPKAMLARLDETIIGDLSVDTHGVITVTVGAHSILTVLFRD